MKRISHRHRALGVLVLLAVASVAPAQGLLIDPAGGTTLTFTNADPATNADDDGSTLRSLGGVYSLYGSPITQLFTQTNGFLSLIEGADFAFDRNTTTLAGLVGSPVIVPLYDDLFVNSSIGNSIVENVGTTYYAVTYAVNGFDDQSTAGRDSIFQAALFNAPTTLRGNTFLPGDIVFSYDKLDHAITDSTFAVGVAQNGANGTGVFGGDGEFTSFAPFTGNFDPTTQALLFRYSPANNTYTQSVVTTAAVPEPGTLPLLAGAGLAGAVIPLRRRRR